MYHPDKRIEEFVGTMFEIGHSEDETIEYEGNTHVHIKAADGKFKLVGSFPIRTAAEKIQKLYLRDGCDYYITGNRFKDNIRKADNLFGLSNIVIDIDCHNGVWLEDHDKMIEENRKRARERDGLIVDLVRNLRDGLFGQEGFPTPNAIVYTGRGVQVWFSLESCSAKLAEIYKKTVHYLCEMITKFIRKFKRFKDFNLDESASANAVGLFRLPGSRNTKAHTKGNFEIIHNKKLDLVLYFNRFVLGFDWNNIKQCFKHQDINLFPINRENMMINYLTYDNSRHAGEEGHRDHVCFIVYNAWLTTSGDEKLAWKRTVDVNNRFVRPLPQSELETYMRSSTRVGGYKLTNDWIISTLGLDEKEMEYIGIAPFQKRKKSDKKRPTYDKMMHTLVAKLAKQGKNKKEIAKETGCSQATVGRYLRSKKILTEKEKRHNMIAFYLYKGKTVKEVMELMRVPRSTVNYIKEKLHLHADRVNATEESLVFVKVRKVKKLRKARKIVELRVNETKKRKRKKKPAEEPAENVNREKFVLDLSELENKIKREVFHEAA